ncbi:MAG TPA: peptidase C39 family protein [Symbiobacteriaceae bacterium]|jgi:hypothetical protein
MPIIAMNDFTQGVHDGTNPVREMGVATAPGQLFGQWTSPVYSSTGPFDWLVASWNGSGERLEVKVRAATPEGWSPWFSFGPWSLAGQRHSIPDQAVPGIGKLDTDTLLLERPARAWQVRVALQDGRLKRLFVAAAMAAYRSADAPYRAAWGKELAVPPRSQMVYPNGGSVWCSPTSVAMVMSFWGKHESIPDKVAPGVYDSIYDGTGNWPFNTAFAATRGFVAYVDRFPGFVDLERKIAAGIPVVAAVAYDRAWLENAVYPHTNGHLLVVTGFTAEGDVIVNDPAAGTDEGVRTVYKREQFKRAWLDRGGVVYVIHPQDTGR